MIVFLFLSYSTLILQIHTLGISSTLRCSPTFIHSSLKSYRQPIHLNGIFDIFRDKLDNFLQQQWVVPPVPTGPKPSDILISRGPIQTDEETSQLLSDLGVEENADADTVIEAMEHQLSILPEDRHSSLKERVNQLLRKKFIDLFKEFESKMEEGPELWREFWNPANKELDSLESLLKNKELNDEGKKFINSALRRKRIEAFFYTLDIAGLIRFTDEKLFRQRLKKSQFLLVFLALSCFEKLAPSCMALQSIVASKIISENIEEEAPVPTSPTSAKTTRSLSARTMMTSLVVASNSLVGAALSKVFQYLAKNVYNINNFSPSVVTALCVNTCLLLSSLFLDTSIMSAEKQRLHDLKRLKSIPQDDFDNDNDDGMGEDVIVYP